jgi:hydroxymethylbilane synthase
LLAQVGGGCLAPIGAWARIEVDQLCLDAVVLSPDGCARIAASAQGSIDEAARLGAEVAERLLLLGAAELIGQSRGAG